MAKPRQAWVSKKRDRYTNVISAFIGPQGPLQDDPKLLGDNGEVSASK